MSKRRQAWSVGDVFLVENKDGLWTVGQIVGQETDVLNSVTCAFYDLRVRGESEGSLREFSLEAPFAVLFVTRDFLDAGVWPVAGHQPIKLRKDQLPYEHLRERGFVGAKVIGTRIISEFLNAFYGLTPWDDWKDPTYLDGLLISPDRKPQGLVFKKRDSGSGLES
jgi:hypothetical protein